MAGVGRVTLLVAALILLIAVPAARSGMPGGWSNVAKNDKELLKAMNFAMTEYNKDSNGHYGRKIVCVSKAQKQIVAGVNYEAQVVTGLTTCTKPINNIDECPLQESPERTTCTFQVYVVPWKGTYEVKKSKCT